MSNPYGNEPYGQQPAGGNPYGPPGGQPGFGAEPVKTDAVSIVGFVLSLLVCTSVIGLILGFVGLSRTKNGKRKGRWAAIAAVVIGILGTLLLVGIIVLGGVLGSLLGESVDDLEAGQCINAEGLNADTDDPVSQIEVVSCSSGHDGEVLATKSLTADEVDGFTSNDAIELCEPELSGTEAKLTRDPQYLFIGLTQAADPASGDQLACIVANADGSSIDEKLGD